MGHEALPLPGLLAALVLDRASTEDCGLQSGQDSRVQEKIVQARVRSVWLRSAGLETRGDRATSEPTVQLSGTMASDEIAKGTQVAQHFLEMGASLRAPFPARCECVLRHQCIAIRRWRTRTSLSMREWHFGLNATWARLRFTALCTSRDARPARIHAGASRRSVTRARCGGAQACTMFGLFLGRDDAIRGKRVAKFLRKGCSRDPRDAGARRARAEGAASACTGARWAIRTGASCYAATSSAGAYRGRQRPPLRTP